MYSYILVSEGSELGLWYLTPSTSCGGLRTPSTTGPSGSHCQVEYCRGVGLRTPDMGLKTPSTTDPSGWHGQIEYCQRQPVLLSIAWETLPEMRPNPHSFLLPSPLQSSDKKSQMTRSTQNRTAREARHSDRILKMVSSEHSLRLLTLW